MTLTTIKAHKDPGFEPFLGAVKYVTPQPPCPSLKLTTLIIYLSLLGIPDTEASCTQ